MGKFHLNNGNISALESQVFYPQTAEGITAGSPCKRCNTILKNKWKRCYNCARKLSIIQNEKRKGKTKEYLLKKKYNISLSERDAIAVKQNHTCAICGQNQTKALAVDHCHKTGKVRGLLCDKCNWGLGQFKDSLEILLKAVIYLRDSNHG